MNKKSPKDNPWRFYYLKRNPRRQRQLEYLRVSKNPSSRLLPGDFHHPHPSKAFNALASTGLPPGDLLYTIHIASTILARDGIGKRFFVPRKYRLQRPSFHRTSVRGPLYTIHIASTSLRATASASIASNALASTGLPSGDLFYTIHIRVHILARDGIGKRFFVPRKYRLQRLGFLRTSARGTCCTPSTSRPHPCARRHRQAILRTTQVSPPTPWLPPDFFVRGLIVHHPHRVHILARRHRQVSLTLASPRLPPGFCTIISFRARRRRQTVPKFPMNVMVDSEYRANGPYVKPELSSSQFASASSRIFTFLSRPLLRGLFWLTTLNLVLYFSYLITVRLSCQLKRVSWIQVGYRCPIFRRLEFIV